MEHEAVKKFLNPDEVFVFVLVATFMVQRHASISEATNYSFPPSNLVQISLSQCCVALMERQCLSWPIVNCLNA